AQATDKSVNLATAKLFRVANTPKAIVKLGEARLIPYIQTIGLFRTKAKNVAALSRQLIAEHAGNVPSDHDALTRLPGVGRKNTAHAGQPERRRDRPLSAKHEPRRRGAFSCCSVRALGGRECLVSRAAG